jgi:PhoH-like ATPase
MRKICVLDTSVLLFDPNSILKFADNVVWIPLVVVEELDRFKKVQNENGRNARKFSRLVDDLRKKGFLSEGVELDNGGKLVISVGDNKKASPVNILDLSINDNIILSSALQLKDQGNSVIVISKDINLRLKSDVLGIKSEDYVNKDMDEDELYAGQRIIKLPNKDLLKFSEERILDLDKEDQSNFYPNEYLILEDENNPHHRFVAKYNHKKNALVSLIKSREGLWGIHPKNIEQQFAFDALLDDNIKMLSLVGKAGTGKTLLAIAAGLEMCVNRQNYSRVLVSRPIWPMGRDLGFLPGDVNEKLGPWMQPIFDNMDFLFGSKRVSKTSSWEELINEGLLHVEPLTYIRGRSIPSQFMIIDEAQNLTPHEIKTIITRAGEETKVILTGDCEQIDNPYLDSLNNGLAFCVDRMKREDIVAHAVLKAGERSQLSEIASKLL